MKSIIISLINQFNLFNKKKYLNWITLLFDLFKVMILIFKNKLNNWIKLQFK